MYKKLLLKLFFCPLLLLLSLSSMAQTAVTGKVTDAGGQTIPGATVIIKGTTQGTNTDINGNYRIQAANNAVLVFSSVGFLKQEVAVNSRTVINVVLQGESQNLNEVVVVGYGTQRRKDVTSSVSSVKGDVFKDQPITNPVAGLQGRVAGVDIAVTSGAPDAQPTILIRGEASLHLAQPLYIIDGVRVPDATNINPQDIATIDILKDASAAAIYGSAAAGGVILITTKKGVTREPDVRFSARYGITHPKVISLLDKNDFIKLEDYVNPTFFENADGTAKAGIDTLANTDWTKALYKNAYEQNYNLSVGGAGQSMDYLVSGFYNKQKGIYIKNYSDIGGGRVNTNFKLSKWIKIGEQLAISQRKTSPLAGAEAQQHNAPFRSLPVIPIRDANGNFGSAPAGYAGLSQFGGTNPVGDAFYANAQNYKNNLQSNVYADVSLPFDFNFHTNLSYNYYQENQDYYQESFTIGKIVVGNNSLNKYYIESTQYLTNYLLSWNHNFGKHHIDAVAGYEQITNDYNNINGSESAIGEPGYSFIQTSATNIGLQGKNDDGGLIKSKFARLNYNFNSRYYISGSIRQDADFQKFGPDKQRGTFKGVSAGWNISEEQFFKTILPSVTNLKIRGSYGELGNNNIPPYLFNSTYSQFNTTGGISGGAQNFSPGGPLIIANSSNGLPNPDLAWETVKEANIGIDGELMNGKAYFTVEYYNKNASNVLYNIQLPLSTGFTSQYTANVGEVNTHGVDVLLGYRDKAGKFGYDISVTASFNKNKVTRLSGAATDAIYDGYNYYNIGDANFNTMPGQTLTITKVGLPFGSFYGYKVLGIFKTDADASKQKVNGNVAHAGDLQYQDLNGDGNIDASDRQVIGNPNPKLTYGISAHFTYDNFDLDLLFNGVQGVQLFNGVKSYEQFLFQDGNTTSQVFNDSYFGSNGLTAQPRLGIKNPDGSFTLDPNKNYQSVSSYFVENGSYLKLKNAQLGYTFSSAMLQAVKIKSARVFIMANNVFTITKYKGLDPELGSGPTVGGYNGATTRGLDGVSQYPQARIYSIGVDVNF